METYQMYVASSDSLFLLYANYLKVYNSSSGFLCTLDIGGLQYQSFLSAVLCTLLNMRFCSHSQPLFGLYPVHIGRFAQETDESRIVRTAVIAIRPGTKYPSADVLRYRPSPLKRMVLPSYFSG